MKNEAVIALIYIIGLILIICSLYHYFGGWITLLIVGILFIFEAIKENYKNENK